MKRTLLTLLAIGLASATLPAQTFSGEGTQTSPYQIKTKEDLAALGEAVKGGNTYAGKHFLLVNNLTYTATETFTPIGYTGTAAPKKFAGVFDGGNRTISGLTMSGTYYVGLFSYVDATGVVENLTIDNCKLTSTNSNAGAAAAKSDGAVRNVKVTNLDYTTRNGGYKGGLVGFANAGVVEDCYVTGSIVSSGSVGGVVGQNYANIRNCWSSATIVVQSEGSASAHIGGVASITLTLKGDTARISDSYFVGSIQGAPQNNCAGITATLNVGYVDRCWNGGYITGSGYLGGIVATFDCGVMKDCYNAGTVVGASANTGGIAGIFTNSNKKELRMERCLSVGPLILSAVYRSETCPFVGSGAEKGVITDCRYDRQMVCYGDVKDGMATADLCNGTPLPGFDTKTWEFTAGLYPRLKSTMAGDGAVLNATPIMLGEGQTRVHVTKSFTVGTANGVEWEMRGGTACSLSGANVNVTRTAKAQDLVLTSYLGDFEKRFLVTVYPQIFQGQGTESDPYLIKDKTDMQLLSDAINNQGLDFTGEYLSMTQDIDMAGVTDFQPFGFGSTAVCPFNGNFNGNGHAIKNLGIDALTNKVMNVGLFIMVANDGVVRNLVIDKSCRFKVFRNFAPVAATVYGTVENCRNYADVPSTEGFSAGIVTFLYGTIRNCFNAGTISATEKNGYLGGIFCSAYAGSTVEGCQNAGKITAVFDKAINLGGIGQSSYADMKNCLNTGIVEGGTNSSKMGGIVASDNAAAKMATTISVAPVVAGTLTEVGSVTGAPKGTYSNVYADGQITVYGNEIEGVKIVDTDQLTVSALEGFGSEWTMTAGRYPMLTLFKDLPEAQVGSMPVVFPAGEIRTELTAGGTLYTAAGLAWTVQGDAFSINGDKLNLDKPQAYATGTLTASWQGASKEIPLGALPQAFEGAGTAAQPWLIKTPEDLVKLSESTLGGNVRYNGKYFALANNLDMSGVANFTPVAQSGKFEATFDGRGNTIDNLTVSSTTLASGLFFNIGAPGCVKDLTVGAGSSITGKGSTGALAATLEGKLSGCVNRAKISSTGAIAGGLVGTATANARMENLVNEADINIKQSKVAGICGAVTSANVIGYNLVNRGAVNANTSSYTAGIVAHATGVSLTKCANYGAVTTTGSDGAGILGYTSGATLLDSCVNYGEIQAKTEGAGIAAYASQAIEITAAMNVGKVTVTNQKAAGILAYGNKPEISGCANFGDINNTNASLSSTAAGAAGIVAYADPVISDCCNFGNVSAKDNAGSILGYSKTTYTAASVKNFYNVGEVKATADGAKAVNMFVGKAGKITLTNCVYDKQVLYTSDAEDGVDTKTLLADMGDGFTDGAQGYPMPKGVADYPEARLARTAILFSCATDTYGSVTDWFSLAADPEVKPVATDIFSVEGDKVSPKSYTTGTYEFATTLGTLKRAVQLTLDTKLVTGIEDVTIGNIPVRVEYIGINGIRMTEPVKGAGTVIRRSIFSDGTVKTEKIIL